MAGLALLAGGAIGCEGEAKPAPATPVASAATRPSGATQPAGPLATQPAGPLVERPVVELSRQTLNFAPTRDDLTVGCAVVTVGSSHPVRVNGVEVDRWESIYLKQVGKNQFELPALRIEFAPAPPGGPDAIGCLSVKVWFNEVTNYSDSLLYERGDDRYALLSWCTSPPESFRDTSYKARFRQNRVKTLGEFREKLAQPLPLRMKQTPLRADWGYPMTKGGGRELGEADLKAVRQLMRDRGEPYLLSITGGDATHAEVEAGIGDMTRYQGTRRYKLALGQGVWQVESVVEEPNSRVAKR